MPTCLSAPSITTALKSGALLSATVVQIRITGEPAALDANGTAALIDILAVRTQC
jgi:hypothetical protein